MTYYGWSLDAQYAEQIARTRALEQARALVGTSLPESAALAALLAELGAVGGPTAIVNVRHPTYGATGNGSTDDTTALQAALTAGATLGLPVYFPPGTYKHTVRLDWPAGTIAYGAGWKRTILRYDTPSTGTSGHRSVDATSGPDGYYRISGMLFQCGIKLGNTSAFNLTSSAPYSVFRDCRFINWTKYGLNFQSSWGSVVEGCSFDSINGIASSGDIGTAVIATTDCNQLTLRGNTVIRCDRGFQVEDAYGVTIDGQNGFERIGYKYNDSSVEIENSELAAYHGIVVDGIKGLSIIGNYFEAVRLGNGIDASGLRGYAICNNSFTGDEPGSYGTDTVMDKAIAVDDCRAGTIASNYVLEYVTNWLTGTNMATGASSVILGLDTNEVVDGGVVKVPSTTASGVSGAVWQGAAKVLGTQGAAVADASGGATVDAEARTALNALLARLRTHGVIAT